MLKTAAGISTLVFVLVSAWVGIRLVLLSRRTRGLPEFVFGAGLAVIVGLGYPLLLAGRGSIQDQPETARWLIALSAIPMSLGWSAVWVFTWRVFRPDSGSARGVTLTALSAIALLALATMARTLSTTDLANLDFGSLVFLGTPILAIASYGWGAYESFRYYGMMKKRVALGLADPVVSNRFLLWGLVMIFSSLSAGIPALASGMGIKTVESPPVLVASAITGVLCAGSLWLAFLPPASYLARLRTTS